MAPLPFFAILSLSYYKLQQCCVPGYESVFKRHFSREYTVLGGNVGCAYKKGFTCSCIRINPTNGRESALPVALIYVQCLLLNGRCVLPGFGTKVYRALLIINRSRLFLLVPGHCFGSARWAVLLLLLLLMCSRADSFNVRQCVFAKPHKDTTKLS